MEKTNWIEKIKEAVRIAMNKGLFIEGKYQELRKYYFFIIEGGFEFFIYLDNSISIHTKKGHLFEKYSITDRDDLELKALILSIKEYNEDIAISEFNNFISNQENKPKDINDLDNDDD